MRSEFPDDRGRKLESEEGFGWVQVILPAFIDHAEVSFPGGLLVGEHLVDFPGFQVFRVAGANAEYKF